MQIVLYFLSGHQIEDPEAFVEPVPEALPTDLCPQYSPSISHDEVEYAGSNTSIEVTVQSSGVISGGSDADEQRGGKWAELTDKEDKSDDWGESWSGIEDTGQSVSGIEHIPTTLDKQVEWEQAPAKLEKPVKQVTPRKPSSSSSKLVLKSANTQGNSSSTKSSVGRILSTEDTRRLEEQAVREQEELDLFADMTPKISTSRYLVGSGVSGSGQTGTTPLHSPLGVGDGTSKNTPTPTSTALQYQPQQEVRKSFFGVITSTRCSSDIKIYYRNAVEIGTVRIGMKIFNNSKKTLQLLMSFIMGT